ncbi:hypothetical protein VTL71DRAFT_2737 [Oculimacula yallundae]|uniref:Uncharacterized protein n=1 Tax=Oculimacula yallundae TaxID=86028 RepID=A0ABR4C9R9_9HELO
MSGSNASTKPGTSQLSFFQAIFANMKESPDVDWNIVATQAGYNSGGTARVRFGQIRRELMKGAGTTETKTKTSSKPRTKTTPIKAEVGSGTNTTPSKVTKSLSMRGRNKSVGGRRSKGRKMEKDEEIGDDSDHEDHEDAEKADDASDEMEV